MARPPLLQPPIHLSGAPPADVGPMVVESVQKARPFLGLIGATAVGVTAAYFAPKFFDWALRSWRGDPLHGEPVELELEE